MHFTFLHPEFFVWMLLPVMVLFYFWFTQKSPEFTWLDAKMLERLRTQNSTLSLQSRNVLFLMAAVLMITAMAQPTLYERHANVPRLKVLLILDLNAQHIETSKRWNLEILKKLQEDEVALISATSLISPPTMQHRMLEELISGAGVEDSAPSEEIIQMFAKRYRFDKIVRAEPEALISASEGALKADSVLDELQRIREKVSYRDHVPLFSYPLGVAMLLILIALSSKSARKSVSVEMFLILMFCAHMPSYAALMDFRLLGEAKEAYQNKEYHTSLKKFREYQKMHDSPQIRYNIANVYYKMGKFEEALYWYESVVSKDTGLMRYRNENVKNTLRYLYKRSEKAQEPIKNLNMTVQKGKNRFMQKVTSRPAVYPLKNFLD